MKKQTTETKQFHPQKFSTNLYACSILNASYINFIRKILLVPVSWMKRNECNFDTSKNQRMYIDISVRIDY